MQLALSHATKQAPYFAEFEQTVNDNYKFFQTKNHKRLNLLRKVADEIGEDIYRLNYIYKVK